MMETDVGGKPVYGGKFSQSLEITPYTGFVVLNSFCCVIIAIYTRISISIQPDNNPDWLLFIQTPPILYEWVVEALW